MQKKIFEHYLDGRKRRSRSIGKIDLIVWPETMLRWPWTTYDANCGQPKRLPDCRRPSFANGWNSRHGPCSAWATRPGCSTPP